MLRILDAVVFSWASVFTIKFVGLICEQDGLDNVNATYQTLVGFANSRNSMAINKLHTFLFKYAIWLTLIPGFYLGSPALSKLPPTRENPYGLMSGI